MTYQSPAERQRMADKRQARSGRPPATFHAQTGYWLVPVSDSWLDLHSGQWSEPVCLKAEKLSEADGWHVRVRDARPGERVG